MLLYSPPAGSEGPKQNVKTNKKIIRARIDIAPRAIVGTPGKRN
jgi:hypothetical protein